MVEVKRKVFEIESIVLKELQEKGYPRESIIIEGKLDNRRYADFIVNDLETNLPLMIIEVKSCSNRSLNEVKQMAFKNLKELYKSCDLPIKAIAAILNRDEKGLQFIDFTQAIKDDSFESTIEDYKLPSYDVLTVGARGKAAKKQEEKQKKNINTLKILCWIILPFICVGLLVLDVLSIYTFSVLRLSVIGVGVGILLIPCFKEIKIGEISLVNAIEKQKEERK